MITQGVITQPAGKEMQAGWVRKVCVQNSDVVANVIYAKKINAIVIRFETNICVYVSAMQANLSSKQSGQFPSLLDNCFWSGTQISCNFTAPAASSVSC